MHQNTPLDRSVRESPTKRSCVRVRVCDLCVCVGVWVSVSMSCLFLYVCFCVCLLLWFGFISSGLQHGKSWLGPDREFEKVPLLHKRLPMPTVQNIHGDWLAFALAGAGMPQRLALYSNCVPKPVPFSSKSPKHQNSSASQQFQNTDEKKCYWYPGQQKFVFISCHGSEGD